VKVGTRGSALALAQARQVAQALRAQAPRAQAEGPRAEGPSDPATEVEVVVIQTSGDEGAAPGEKARWVDAIERALLDGEIDLAVHSAKDVPAKLADGLALVGCPARVDPYDALCGASSLSALAQGARVGTSSLRRTAQLKALREDLEVVPMHGNVDTRLRRFEEGDFDAIVLAQAGLWRLGREPGASLPELVPAAGQGTLALQARAGDEAAAAALAEAGLRDPDTELALAAERALVRLLGADCHTAMGAHATVASAGASTASPSTASASTAPASAAAQTDEATGRQIRLCAWIGLADGSAWIADEGLGEDPEALAEQLAERLLAVGAKEMLAA
jgi:hydroxymethylbilane synthase